MGYCILNRARMAISTDTYSATTRSNSIDLGAINTVRYIDTTGVPNSNSDTYTASSKNAALDMGETNTYRYVNTSGIANVNSGTYTASSRGASLDMGASNSYRYVNTNSVPNTNSATYTPSSNGSALDMGATNSYRYVNTNTVYNLGASNVISSIASTATYTIEKSSDSGGKGTQTWSRSLSAGNYIAVLAGALNYSSTAYMTLSITGSHLSNLTKLYDICKAWVDNWKTGAMIAYKFRVSSTSTISFACNNSRGTDAVNLLAIIKIS